MKQFLFVVFLAEFRGSYYSFILSIETSILKFDINLMNLYTPHLALHDHWFQGWCPWVLLPWWQHCSAWLGVTTDVGGGHDNWAATSPPAAPPSALPAASLCALPSGALACLASVKKANRKEQPWNSCLVRCMFSRQWQKSPCFPLIASVLMLFQASHLDVQFTLRTPFCICKKASSVSQRPILLVSFCVLVQCLRNTYSCHAFNKWTNMLVHETQVTTRHKHHENPQWLLSRFWSVFHNNTSDTQVIKHAWMKEEGSSFIIVHIFCKLIRGADPADKAFFFFSLRALDVNMCLQCNSGAT